MVGSYFHLQGILLTQGSNPSLLNLRQTFYHLSHHFQFSSVAQMCPTPWDPINHSTPGLPIHQLLLEFTQTHAHQVGDIIQPSHPLSSPSPPAPNPSQNQDLFQWVNPSHEVAKVFVSASASVLPMNAHDWSSLGWTGWISLQSKGLSRVEKVFIRKQIKKNCIFKNTL